MVAVIIMIKKKKKGNNYNKQNFNNTSKSYSGHKDLNKPPFARFDAKFMKNMKPTTNLDEDNVPENLMKLKENFETFKKDKSKEKRSFSKSSSNSNSQQKFIPEIGFGNDYQSLEANRRKLPRKTENIKKTPKKSDENLKKIISTRKDSKTFPKPSKLRKESSSSNTQKKARRKQRKNSKRKQNSKQNVSKRSDSKKC